MTTQLTLESAYAARDPAMAQVADHAGERFRRDARAFVLRFLGQVDEATGEAITDACWAAGITAHTAKAMGPVYAGLARDGLIRRVGFAARTKGHGSAGASVWGLA